MNKSSSVVEYGFSEGYVPHTNRILLPHIVEYARGISAKSAIDIGCGNGALTRELASVCPLVVGLDPSASGIAAAKANCPNGIFYEMSVYDPPERISETDLDLAVSTEVIEHLFLPRELLRLAHKKLRTGGLFVISTPYHGWLKNSALSFLNKWDSHHGSSWDGGHVKFWSKATLAQLLEQEGFEVVGFRGCGRIPYLWASMIVVGRKLPLA